MEEFFESSFRAPPLTSFARENSDFNFLHHGTSPEFTNGYIANNNTENYLFPYSEYPQSFTGDTSFLSDSSIFPLLYSNDNLMGDNMLELMNCVEDKDNNNTMAAIFFHKSQSGSTSPHMAANQLVENEIYDPNPPIFDPKSMPNGKAILLGGDGISEENNLTSLLSYETPKLKTAKYKVNFSEGDQSQTTHVTESVSNEQVKSTRARRGWATHPHSIAERQRREKITTGMKNLQELIHSDKIDRAIMLDEAIKYVKFLKIQVQILSMRRLCGPGTVVPFFTESQFEKSAKNSTETSGMIEQEDNLALEREVARLMESNMTSALQFLQNKGLCLVPVWLASSISNQNDFSSSGSP